MPATDPSSEIIVAVDDVTFAWREVPVLNHCELKVPAGVFLGLIGPNGGGKTTLIKLILGLLRPQSGTVRVFGRPAASLGSSRRLIGYVPQRSEVDWSFPATVRDVVLMGAFSTAGIMRRVPLELRERAEQVMELTGIADLADRPIGKLSGGQQQRAFVARALLPEPRLMLLDEPTVGVDTGGQEAFFNLLRDMQQRFSLTIIMSSHDLQHIRHAADRLACVSRKVHWHDRSDLITAETLQSLYACELDAFLSHEQKYHVHGVCSEDEAGAGGIE